MTDYASLAAQYGGAPADGDYSTLAKQFGGVSDAPAPRDPKIGQPQELSFAEKYLAPLLEKTGLGDVAGGNVRGSAVGRTAMGLADPGVALVQMGANAVGHAAAPYVDLQPQVDAVNKGIQATEQQYQDARKQAGSEGFDPLRLAGNIGMSTFIGAAAPGSALLDKAAPVVQAGVKGAGFGLLQPVVDGGQDYLAEKAKQGGLGALGGAVMERLGAGAARIVSPNASVNPDLQILKEAGVRPTVGQTLGGWANTLEEKAQSLPILGDAISAARRHATKDFNNAVINTATAPIGESVEGAGFGAVGEAGGKLSAAYNKAAADVGSVNLNTPAFNDGLQSVVDKAASLTPDMRDRFQAILKDEVLRRMDPSGTVQGGNIKTIDAALGQLAAGWKSSASQSERELGGVVRDLQQTIRSGIADISPEYSAARESADQGWRAFRLARNAAAAAKNREGIFTPAQFNSAIQQDAGKAAVGEGRAFMQDAGQAAQNVLGNKYPDSGTVGRYIINSLAMPAHYATSGATVLGLGAGALGYTAPVQNVLRAIISSRPDAAPQAANQLRRLLASSGGVTVPMIEAARR